MTKDEALARWSEAAGAEPAGGEKYARAGNWEPIARALRHVKDGDTIEVLSEGERESTLKVTVTREAVEKTDTTPAKPAFTRSFLLIVT